MTLIEEKRKITNTITCLEDKLYYFNVSSFINHLIYTETKKNALCNNTCLLVENNQNVETIIRGNQTKMNLLNDTGL